MVAPFLIISLLALAEKCKTMSVCCASRSRVINGSQGLACNWRGPRCRKQWMTRWAGSPRDPQGHRGHRIQAGEEVKPKHHWIFQRPCGEPPLFRKHESRVSNSRLETRREAKFNAGKIQSTMYNCSGSRSWCKQGKFKTIPIYLWNFS